MEIVSIHPAYDLLSNRDAGFALNRVAHAYTRLDCDGERNHAVNAGVGGRVHADGSAVEVWGIPTDEGKVMAEAALDTLTSRMSLAQPSTMEKRT